MQREAENQEIAARLLELDVEQNASAARDGLLQVESEQIRSTLVEIDEVLRNLRQLLEARARPSRRTIGVGCQIALRRSIYV